MKKYIIPVIVLTVVGTLISIALMYQHYNINSELVNFFCGDSINNSCRALSLSEYSAFFNVPVSVYGLLFYSFVLIITIIFLYTGEEYRFIYAVIVFPLSSISVIISVIFICIMFIIGSFCSLCLAVHLINAVLLFILILFLKKIGKEGEFKISVLIQKFRNTLNSVSHARAGMAAFTVFVVFFVFSIFSIAKINELRTTEKITSDKIIKFINKYEAANPEKLNLHNSPLIAGNRDAEITITVFSDFLCSYCYKLYNIEEYLLKRFKNKIKFEYYNFPLDTQCNGNIRRSVYDNSCIASKAMFASAELGIFEEYMKEHFNNYKEVKSEYGMEKAMMILKNIGRDSMKEKFKSLINSENISVMLKKDIQAAKNIEIRATPTIFIANKRIGGVRPVEVFEHIISKELQKLEKNNRDD